MQIGKFYEAYSTKTQGYTNLEELESLLGTKLIRRDLDGADSQRNQTNLATTA